MNYGKTIGLTGVLIALAGALSLNDNMLLIGFGLPCIGIVIDSFENIMKETKQ